MPWCRAGLHLEAFLTYAPQFFDFMDKHKK